MPTGDATFQSAVRIAVSLKVGGFYAYITRLDQFQSAVRIAVSLKLISSLRNRCVVQFHSAVRIAVSLKYLDGRPVCSICWSVSIRRADRCLAEAGRRNGGNRWLYHVFQSAVRIAVSLKIIAIIERFRLHIVSIRRADRCLAEDRPRK